MGEKNYSLTFYLDIVLCICLPVLSGLDGDEQKMDAEIDSVINNTGVSGSKLM
ncbi:hypothetical protein T02_8852 [Trichinella nativa]|uniref:Uncharacterized protein n=1 Tax=Trichinella nativa TaxID=6335 RepID=A0A0V1KLY0_9BILA|nr:hypothetical protein T02_8852 [Trichinella nativa]